jgi:hypothetical protein
VLGLGLLALGHLVSRWASGADLGAPEFWREFITDELVVWALILPGILMYVSIAAVLMSTLILPDLAIQRFKKWRSSRRAG